MHRLDKIPKGSRLEEYLRKIPDKLKGTNGNLFDVLNDILRDCIAFLEESGMKIPPIVVEFVRSHQEYLAKEQEYNLKCSPKEVAKSQSSSFIVGNRLGARIFVDVEQLIGLLEHGYATFIYNLVADYIHELIHAVFPEEEEQKIFDLECEFIEKFLGIKLPNEIKKRKASDYYEKRE